jgi:hypothetical protein
VKALVNEYYCKRIKENIDIDGNLDKVEWIGIEDLNLVETVTGSPANLETKVKAMWNDSFLYFAFRCKDDFIKATMTKYNDKLYEEDVVEIFIDDNCDRKTYIEIEVNPLNAVLHYFINNNLENEFWGFARVEKSITTAVIYNKELGEWHTEIAIPLKEFITAKNNPPNIGDKWFVNCYRIDRGENGEDEYSAWSSTGKLNFHMPEKFGELIFIE